MPNIASKDFEQLQSISAIRSQITAAQKDASIEKLDLSYSEFDEFDNQCWNMCFKGLEKTHISSVDLSDTFLNKVGIAGVKEILTLLSKIKSLDLSWNKLDEFGSALFTEALKPLEKSEVTALDLSSNKSDKSHFDIKQFAQGLPKLKNTHLNSIGLKGLDVYEGFTEIINALKETSITSVDFGFNELYRLGATGPQKFEILKDGKIKWVGLGYNELDKLGAENFVGWLIALANTPIVGIDLCGNNIDKINNLHHKLIEQIPFPLSLKLKKLTLNIHEGIKEISFIDFYLQNLARHLVDDVNRQIAQPQQERTESKIKIIEPSISIESKQFTALIAEDDEQLKILIKSLENIKHDSIFGKAAELILLQIEQLNKTSSKHLHRSAPTFFKEPKNRDDDKDVNPSRHATHKAQP